MVLCPPFPNKEQDTGPIILVIIKLQKIRYTALGAVGFGHVAVGFQTCDGRFFFESLGPGSYIFPTTVKADIETKIFATWADAEKWISVVNPQYTKIKIIRINNPDPNAALNEMNKPENYNLLASTSWNRETEDNCLTYTIKVLTAYGVKGLTTSPPTEAPNMYFEAYIPGKEYSWNINRYSDSEGNAINVDSIAPEEPKAAAGRASIGTQGTIEGKDATAWNDTASTLFLQGKYDEAIQAFDKAIELKPNYAEAWNLKGIAFCQLGKFDEAIQAFNKAIELKPNYALAWLEKGGALAAQGMDLSDQSKYDEAIQAFNKAIELEPNDALAWVMKGVYLKVLHRDAEADAALAKGKELAGPTAPA